MAQQGQVTKIYELRTLGYDDLGKQLDNINAKFEAIKKTKLSAQGKLAAASDVADLKKYGDELAKLQIQEQEYRTERQKLLTEQKAATIQRQAEINQRKQEQKSVEAAAGSYAELYKQYKELYALVKAAPKGSPVTFQGNTLQFDQAIAKLQQLAAAEQDFRRQFSRDSLLVGEYTSGIVQAFKKMGLDDLIGGQIMKAQGNLQALNAEFGELKQELSEIKVTGNGSLETVEQKLIENRKAAAQLQEQIGTLQTEFRSAGGIGNQITESLNKGFKGLGKNITSFALQFYGINAALNGLFSGLRNVVSENASLSDSFADLQRIMGTTEDITNNVVAALRKIDTRTSLKGLTDIAIIAARAGVAADDIAGVTKAIDQLNIVAGKELGNVEDATNSIVRLVNIFSKDGKVTEDSVLSIGNGLITLANAGTASGDYLIDFSKRMAGLAKTAKVTIPVVLGLGAGFQELGVSQEIAGTATAKAMFQIGQDVPKYAALAGKSVKEFSDTLKNDPTEALIELTEALTKGEGGLEDIAKAFKLAGFNRTTYAQALSVLGKRADYFRDKINLASKAVNNTNEIIDGATKKQNTFGATLDKVAKKFELIGTNKFFQSTIIAAASAVAFLVNNMNILLPVLGSLAVAYTAYNALLTYNAFLQGTLKEKTLAYFILNGLRVIRMGIMNGLQAVQNTLVAAYTALTIAASTATGAYAIVLRGLAAAFKFLTGPVGLAIAGITALVTIIGLSEAHAATASNANDKLAKSAQNLASVQRVHAAVMKSVTDATEDQIAKIKTLTSVIDSSATSSKTKVAALNELIKISPKYRDALQGQQVDIAKVTKLSNELIESLKKQAQAAAYAQLAQDKEKQKIQLETQIAELGPINSANEASQGAALKNFFHNFLSIGKGTTGQQISDLQDQLDDVNKDLETIYGKVGKNKDLQQAIIDEAGKPTGGIIPTKTKRSQLSATLQDALRDADALRDQQLADEKIRQTQGKVDEETYLRDILKINQDAIDKKLTLIKGETVAEKSERAKLQLERIQDEQDTNQKIFSLRSQALKNNMQLAVKAAQDEAKKVQDDPTASASAKAQAQLDADNKILQLQQNYATDLDKLEKQLGQQSLKNEKDADAAILDTRRKLHEDEIAIDQAALKDLQTKEATDIAKFKAAISAKRTDVLNSNASDQRKDIALNTLGQEEDRGVLAREVKSMQEQLPIYQKLLAEKKITDEDYYNFIADLNKKQEDLHNSLTKTADLALQKVTSIKDLLANSFRDILNINPDSTADQLLVQTISQTYQFATDAMNSYYDQKQARIAQDLQTQLTQLDAEKQAAEDHAQTQAEKNAIDAEYQKKEDALNRKAFEAKKKAQIAQAAVNLGIQLSNLAVIAFSPNPANIATLGAAGAIMYAIQAAVAVGQYALNVSRIKNAQYEQGGQPGDVPTRGGKFGGKPHSQGGTPFGYKGQTYEAEVDELSVIRTKNAPRNKVFTITGNHTQIASALNELGGGISFAGGASVRKMAAGGHLGESLQPPVFIPAVNQTLVNSYQGVTKDDMTGFMDEIRGLADEQSKRIDRLEVVQVTGTVTKAQRKQTKQTSIGTLS